ncbi:Homocysteine S-methyltransferase 1 [Gonapodya sp. JEL0774]|nr:Homocysteine S-methyltransferase 1 [Gonapodya sp. JEL0774]
MSCSGPIFQPPLFSSCFIGLVLPAVLVFYLIVAGSFRYVSVRPRRIRLPEDPNDGTSFRARPQSPVTYLSVTQASSIIISFNAIVVLLVLLEALTHLNRRGFLGSPHLLAGSLLALAAWLTISAILYVESSARRRKRKALRTAAAAAAASAASAAGSLGSQRAINGNGTSTNDGSKQGISPSTPHSSRSSELAGAWTDLEDRWSIVPGFWLLATLADTVVAYQWAVLISSPSDGAQPNYLYITLFAARFLFEITLLAIVAISYCVSLYRQSNPSTIEEGHPSASTPESATDDTSTFDYFWEKMYTLLPYVWPTKSVKLQLLVVFCFTILIIGRIVNVLVVLQYKIVIDQLAAVKDSPGFTWGNIFLFVFYRFLQGGVGLLSSVQSLAWISIGQYSTRVVSVDLFAHLHSLSLQWHLQRKTGEVLRIVDRGTNSIVSLLSYILFNIFPVFADIIIACGVFLVAFDWSIALVVFLTMSLYIVFTVIITEWRTSFRREMIDLDNATRTRSVDSLLNFETVKYYGNEAYEVNEYEKAIVAYQAADWKSSASLTVLNTSQNAIITLGLLAGCLLCAREVVDGMLTVGDFVMFLTYITQLYGPLNWFGTYYRMIQQNFVDMEKMLDLFEESAAVRDAPDATELVLENGHVVFDHVSFEYDPKQAAIKDISFEIPPGKSVALVGPSGSGKSTIMRLLFRFYDVKAGRITIDGKDIRSVTQQSLRKHIGVVPQDTVLFNDTVKNNIKYAKVNATDEEVEEAAKVGQIHERILTFKDGYSTKVGERGLRLSGGEKQRVAIARTVLKNPRILLLDEATSALDTVTERLIQDAIRNLTENRTTLIIAHRLSTIVGVDKVIVLKDGGIVEQGTHNELLAKNGLYHDLWTQQLKETEIAKEQGTVVDEDIRGNLEPKKHA